ncbi:MAG: peptidoglycan-binding protein [Treponema sp.]|nr:peptidoglycan-binding protein [Treponema sp.]
MNCKKNLDRAYEFFEQDFHNSITIFTRIKVGFHLLVCPDCARKIGRFEECKDIMSREFLPPSQNLENSVMAMIAAEEGEAFNLEEIETLGGFSVRGWVIAGLVMLVSLTSAFFGIEFHNMALTNGISFMIPIGITIGIALSCYGAIFIGSHLKQFTQRFGL